MNRLQKQAYFNIAGVVIWLILLAVLLGLQWKYHFLPENMNAGHFSAYSLLYFCGVSVLSVLIFRKRRNGVVQDERDEYIRSKSMKISLFLYFLIFSVGMMSPFFLMGASGQISVLFGPIVFIAGFVFFIFVFSIIVLFLYSNDSQQGKKGVA